MMNNKPELEIYADDVVCGHGATIAQINDDQLFYLMSRGLPKAQAQAMLIESFAQDMLEQMSDDGLRHHYHAAIQHWMQEALA
jgi:Fe-S cluster assembly protein SufD